MANCSHPNIQMDQAAARSHGSIRLLPSMHFHSMDSLRRGARARDVRRHGRTDGRVRGCGPRSRCVAGGAGQRVTAAPVDRRGAIAGWSRSAFSSVGTACLIGTARTPTTTASRKDGRTGRLKGWAGPGLNVVCLLGYPYQASYFRPSQIESFQITGPFSDHFFFPTAGK